jgi:carbonic anhydrase/acetyltransferase-like protein (isoleucine patch superfamily)
VLSERAEVAPGMLAAGVPASEKKELSGSAKGWTEHAAAEYQHLRARYLSGARFETMENEPLPG